MRVLGRIILVVLAVVGSFTLLIAGLGVWTAVKERPDPLPKQMVLMLDLNSGIVESGSDSPFAKLEMNNAYVLKDVVQALDKASRDPRVAAVVARFDGGHLGMAKAQELRDAVLAFRKSGKRAVLFSSSMGESSAATVGYYTASAFQEIWLQPSGDVGLTGFMAESPFFREALDFIGVKPEFGARYEYKSAIETFTSKQFSNEARQSLEKLLGAWTAQVVNGIAEARGLKPEQVQALIDRSPLLAQEARDGGLVDRLAYWDEAEKSLTDGGAKLVDIADYAARSPEEPGTLKVALIYGVGAVQRGDGDNSPFSDGGVMSSERITKAFRDAVKDSSVKAILFRIDSPGGSYTASDAIWREVVNARAAGKPVVVSMGDVAASGGYFAAMAADKIIAEPGTITGSIGVFSGKMVVADLWKKLGVSWDEVHSGQNAGMWSSNQPFSPAAWERMNAMLDHVYLDFTGKAEQARKITPDAMDKLARGRIWPGDEAKTVGLIDETGGYATAFAAIRQLARQPTQMPVNLVQFPKPKEPIDYLLEMARTGRAPSELSAALSVGTRLDRLTALLQPLSALVATGDSEVRMPVVQVK